MACTPLKRTRQIGLAALASVGVALTAEAQTAPPTAPPPDVRLSPGGNTTLELPQVDVTGQRAPSATAVIGQPPPVYPGGQVATGGRVGLLGNRSNADTPFTQNNYTEQLIRNEQDRHLVDVLDNDPAVRTTQSPFGLQSEFYVRGLELNGRDLAFDGLYGVATAFRPQLEGIERVEVLNGPAALLYGFPPGGTSAGVINLIPKRAGDVPLTRVTTEYDSSGTGGASFDVGRRFGHDDAFGVRVNGAFRDGDTPLKNNHERFGDIILGTDYRGDRLRVSLDGGLQKIDTAATPTSIFVAPGFAIPKAPSLTSNVHNKWETFDGTQLFGVLRAEYDILPNLTAYAAIGGSRLDVNWYYTVPTIVNARGDLSLSTFLPVSSRQDQWTAEAGLRSQLQLGPVTDKVTLGYSHFGEHQPYAIGFGPSYQSNLYTPTYLPSPTNSGARIRFPDSYEHLDGATLINTFSVLDERIQLLAGGRFQVAEEYSMDAATGVRSAFSSKDAVTPLAALIVKPITPLSVYVSYAESFGFGPIAPTGAINANQTFPPVVTKSVETGVKLDFGRIGGSAALFQTTLPSGFTDPTTRVFGVNGEQRNRGIDTTIFGTPMEGVRALGGMTLIDGKLTQTAGGALNGRTAPGAPAVQLNVGGEYDLPWLKGLTTSARVIYTSKQYYDQANTQSIPAWTRLDLGARYGFEWNGRPVNARFNVQNALGTRYWASTGQGTLALGTPQTFLFSLSTDL